MKRILGLSAAVAGLLVSAAGSAAVVPVSVVVDLNGSGAHLSADGSSLIVTAAQLASPLAIKDGDTLQYTITFAGNETLTVTDADSFQTRLQAVSGSPTTATASTGKLKLLGANVTSESTTTTSSDSTTEFVNAVTKFSTLPSPVTFTGFYWEGTVDYTGFNDALGTTRLFDTPSFTLAADSITLAGSAPSVPEPASWAMMVIGFGVVGAGLRGRRSASVKFA